MRIVLGRSSLYATGLMTEATLKGPSHLGMSLLEDGPLSLTDVPCVKEHHIAWLERGVRPFAIGDIVLLSRLGVIQQLLCFFEVGFQAGAQV